MSFTVAMLEAMQAEGLDLTACIRVLKAGEKKDDPTAAERQARYRARKTSRRNVTRNGSPNESNLTPPEVTPTPSGVGPKPEKSRGTRLPESWELSPDWAAFAKQRRRWSDSDIAEEAILFANYWHSKSGAGAVHRDWFKTWQNWVIRSHRKDGNSAEIERSPAEARDWYLRNAEVFEKFGKLDDAARNRKHAEALEEEHPEIRSRVVEIIGSTVRSLGG